MYDGKKVDCKSLPNEKTFQDIWELNREICQQNASTEGKTCPFYQANDAPAQLNSCTQSLENRASNPKEEQDCLRSFQLRAVETWLKVHKDQPSYVDLLERSLIPRFPTDLTWKEGNLQNNRALLSQLNRFCYRCHSSVVYNVFDKQAVAAWAPLLLSFIDRKDCAAISKQLEPEGEKDELCMPPDRNLSQVQIMKLKDSFNAIGIGHKQFIGREQ
jgi:hypothetical protein